MPGRSPLLEGELLDGDREERRRSREKHLPRVETKGDMVTYLLYIFNMSFFFYNITIYSLFFNSLSLMKLKVSPNCCFFNKQCIS